MADWKLMNELPTTDGAFLCTVEATEEGKTWRFVAECDFRKDINCFILRDGGEYGESCFMYMNGYRDWTGDWGPFCADDTESSTIHCKMIAWMPKPEPYAGDGYTGEADEDYSYECN